MYSLFLSRCVFAVATVALIATAARADENTTTIKFSNPDKPGTLKVSLARGDVHIKGSNAPDVVVRSDTTAPSKKTRKDGLRVLTESAAYALNEKDNVITLDAMSEGWSGTPSDFQVIVPRGTNVVISCSLGGDVHCAGVTGDIEVKILNGEVHLDDLVGGALVETTNGEITANVREIHDNKPLSFTSTNGAVVLNVPANAKANVRLRTQNGSILTDFDEKALVTKVEALPGDRHGAAGILTAETREAFREAARAGAEAARRAAEAVREAAEAARQGAEAATGDDGKGSNQPHVVIPPIPPIPPIPAIPTITGGKLVTGTLNGGGPEISVATLNGDVTLRKAN